MKVLSGICLLMWSAWAACSPSTGEGEDTPTGEGTTSGSAGQASSAQGGGGAVAATGGTQNVAGASGTPSQAGAGGAPMVIAMDAGGTTVTPCPADNVTSCPPSGGFTPPCGAGHCTDPSGKPIVQTTTYDTCHPDRLPTMGVGHPVNAMKGKFLPTLHGNEGDDDQCKYHVKVAVDAAAKNQDVFFTLNATNLGDGSLVKDNDPTPAVDVFLTPTHMAPKTDVKSMMTSPGTFKVGPVRFDQCGQWTARFHFFNHCGNDFSDSPYANIAFFVNVP